MSQPTCSVLPRGFPSALKTDGKIFLAVHFGAGEHSKKRSDIYVRLGERACRKGLRILRNGGSADDAVIQAMIILENSKKLNAGSGSHLTMAETVELDAGFMSGTGRFGGIGAVSGIPNPCMAARELANLQADILVPPNLLVGSAARNWASSAGIKTCEENKLICKRSRRLYERYLQDRSSAMCHTDSDTIGAVALDSTGHVAACGSTGGGLYKMPGRIGPVAQYGCGVFACDQSEDGSVATAISASGTGEFLTAIRFAASCGDAIQSEVNDSIHAIKKIMEEKIIRRSAINQWMKPPIAGMIGLVWYGSRGEFIVCHNSQNMVYAYGNSALKNKVKVRYSEKSPNANYKLQVFNM